MDQSQDDKKSVNIWNKFESAAPGVPDWIQNKEQTSNILHTLLNTIPAKAILISTTSDVFLQVGDVEESTQQKILQVLNGFWDPVQKSDLTRYLKSQTGEVTAFIFCANLFQQLIITLYYPDTPTLSMARAHTKRIIRALSGQTVASYEAKTIPVDAAVAAQMRKFYEQRAKQSDSDSDTVEELPIAKVGPLIQENQTIETKEEQPQSVAVQQIEPVIEDVQSIEDILPSMDDLLGKETITQDVDVSPGTVGEEILQDSESQSSPAEPVVDTQNIDFNQTVHEIEEISDEDLAQLNDELDDFFMDDDDSGIDLTEQKEKLAALLQELPAPDPDQQPDPEMNAEANAMLSDGAPSSENGDFTLPWEGTDAADKPLTAPVEIEQESGFAEPPAVQGDPSSFQQAMQQAQAETSGGPRPFTVVLISRIGFHELGLPFEKKFEQYFQQTCQAIDCEAENVQLFSDHIQLKIQFSGKGSIARTIMQLKKLLELKIIENYSTLTEELGENELWMPGQLLFSNQEKLDSKKIQEFIKNAQS
ncbi:MAG: transposase [Anaerolineaceae bacterium]|nr:transposase [Anaerolineaceae bacterium]